MEDEKLEEKFRELTMQLESMETEYGLLKIEIQGLSMKVERVKDELTMPSGRMSQGFSKLEKQIQQLGAKPIS